MTDLPVHQELLFIDDFLHQNSDSVHWDHIKFNHPVFLEQIRIIPQNCSISLKNGSYYYGSTNPKRFKLEFYANNLNKKDQECATLEKIGSLSYNDSENLNEQIDQSTDLINNYIVKPQSIPIDWLVIVGSYVSLSIALIGVKAKQSSSIPFPNQFNRPTQFSNNIPLLPTPTHLPTLIHSTSSPSLITIPPNQPQNIRRFPLPPINPQQRTVPFINNNNTNGVRHHPYNRPQIQFNNQIQPQIQQQSKLPIQSISPEPVKTKSNEDESNELVEVIEDENGSTNEVDEINDENESQYVESALVKYYLDLDEQKDEADLISSSNSIYNNMISSKLNQSSPNKLKIDNIEHINDLDDYLEKMFDPFEFRLNIKSSMQNESSNLVHKLKQDKSEQDKSEQEDEINLDNLELLFDANNEKLLNDENILRNFLHKTFLLLNTNNFNLIQNDLKQLNLILKCINNFYTKNLSLSSFIDEQICDKIINFYFEIIHLYSNSINNNESIQLKLLTSLDKYILNYSSNTIDLFIKQNYYTKLVNNYLTNINQSRQTSRLTLAYSSLLSKISFYESLKLLKLKCQSKFLVSVESSVNYDINFINDIKNLYETILIYLLKSLKNESDFTRPPGQPLFDSVISSNQSIKFTQLLNLLESTQFFNNTLLLWSYLFDNVIDKTEQEAKILTNLIESFLNDFVLPSDFNSNLFNGIEFLISRPNLTNCIFSILLPGVLKYHSPAALKLSYSIYLFQLFNQLNLNLIKIKNELFDVSDRTILILTSVELIQSIDFLLINQIKQNYLIDFLCLPDGNMSNKNLRVLLDWFEFLIEDNLFGYDQNDSYLNNTRCYLLNSLTNIFYTICKMNKNWSLNSSLNEIRQLNKLSSNLINYLIITKLKPSANKNQSYFILIEKLKTIMSILEPFLYNLKENLNLKTNQHERLLLNLALKSSESAQRTTYLNGLIDSFRDNIDKNLNLFFYKYLTQFKQIKRGSKLKINYLNPNITQLRLIKNLFQKSNQNFTQFDYVFKNFDLNKKMMKKIYLGHLINRNTIHIIGNFLTRLNDYFIFYDTKLIDLNSLSMYEQLYSLIELAVYIIKINVLNIFNCRHENYNDFYILQILFDFYAWFNFVNQTIITNLRQQTLHMTIRKKYNFKNSIIYKSNKVQFNQLSTDFTNINRYLIEIFITFFQYLPHKFLNEISKFNLKTPFNSIFGLSIINQTLAESNLLNFKRDSLSLLIKKLFKNESTFYLVDEELITETKSNFVESMCQLSLSGSKTKLNNLFMRVCFQLSDLSVEVCSNLLKIFIDYSVELMGKIKLNFNLIDIEVAKKEEETEQINNSDMQGELTDDSLYDTSLVEIGDQMNINETKHDMIDDEKLLVKNDHLSQDAQTNINDLFKSSLIDNFTRLIKFLQSFVRFDRDLIRIQFLNLIKPKVKFNTNELNLNLKSFSDYSLYLFNLNKYFNQIDLNLDHVSGFKSELFKVQEAILNLNSYLIGNFSQLFLNQIEQNDFNYFENENKEDDDCLSLNNYLINILIEHLNLTKLESLSVTSEVLTCLIKLNKIYSVYYDLNNLNKKSEFLNPIVKFHLKYKNSNYLIKFMSELTNLFTNHKQKVVNYSQSILIDLLNKFYIYLNQISFYLYESNKIDKLTSELLKWTETNSNDILIDSISTSNPFSSNLHLHSLINLDKQIESYQHTNTLLLSKDIKYKYLLNQSKKYLKLLNDRDFGSYFNHKFKLDLESLYKFNLNMTDLNLVTNTDDMKKPISEMTESDPAVSNQNDLEITVDLNQPAELVLMTDKDLYKKLQSNLDEHYQQLHTQIQILDETNNLSNINGDNLNGKFDDKNFKLNNPDVINTRTGVRYRAPMRGGHANQQHRVVLPSLNNSVSSPSLLANPTSTIMNPPGIVRHDSFRTRPPNTSRPPSLHVDDYYRIEQQQKQLNSNLNGSASANTSQNQLDVTSNDNSLSRNNSFNSNDCNTFSKHTNQQACLNSSVNSYQENEALNNSSNSVISNNSIDVIQHQQQQNFVSPNTSGNNNNNSVNNENNNLIVINSISNTNNNNIESNFNRLPNQNFINLNNSMNNNPITNIVPSIVPNQFMTQIQPQLIKAPSNTNQFTNQYQIMDQNIQQHRFNRPNQFDRNIAINMNMQYQNNQNAQFTNSNSNNDSIQPFNTAININTNINDSMSHLINQLNSPVHQINSLHSQLSPNQLKNQVQQQNQQTQPILSPNHNYQNNSRYQHGGQIRGHMYRGGMRRMPNPGQNINMNNSNNNSGGSSNSSIRLQYNHQQQR